VQIVENRPRKVMPKTRFGRSAPALNGRVGSDAGQLPYKSVFVVTFQKKMSPGPKNGLGSRVSRFSTVFLGAAKSMHGSRAAPPRGFP
jgi:hypothetical protein